VRFGAPLPIGPDDSVERIVELLTKAIVPSDPPPRRFGTRSQADTDQDGPERADRSETIHAG